MKHLLTGGIGFLTWLGGGWYWGMDYTSGDLYEAEELYRDGHPIRKNRLIFVRWPEGDVYEPIRAEDGEYLGRPALFEGSLHCLLVSFPQETIRILRWDPEEDQVTETAALPLQAVPDCYNLMLDIAPLTLVRQGAENRFQVVWPEKGDFAIGERETFDYREGDRLIFARWEEDPDYREEYVIRHYPDGEILESGNGTVQTMPDGQKWLLT